MEDFIFDNAYSSVVIRADLEILERGVIRLDAGQRYDIALDKLGQRIIGHQVGEFVGITPIPRYGDFDILNLEILIFHITHTQERERRQGNTRLLALNIFGRKLLTRLFSG